MAEAPGRNRSAHRRFRATKRGPRRRAAIRRNFAARDPRILGFEVAIETIEGKFKLNQNRPDEDRRAVIARLAEQDDSPSREMYALMRRLDAR
jgi:predicted FMN-binding regulatory protein PaiB